MNIIDFRSDTVTWPTPEMREAMATAQVGDDVYGEDPTVNELEHLAAEMLGFEAGLFVASGTQGNLTALLTHTNRGDEVIMGLDAHTFTSEAAGAAVLGGITYLPLPTDHLGRMNVEQVAAAIRPNDPHYPVTRLISTENSSGSNNGAAISPNYFAALREVADQHHLALHMDGARFFNATAALQIDPKEITQYIDSTSICLSKGLCAPVGSVLVGSQEFIQKARRVRKILGGGMRQAGVLAAAGLISLREMTKRLHIDHQNARLLAEGLAKIPGILIDPAVVQTNLVFFHLDDTVQIPKEEISARLKKDYNILISSNYRLQKFRAVTHYWITAKEVHLLLKALGEILAA